MVAIGRYRFDLFEGPVSNTAGSENHVLRFASIDDLPMLEVLDVRPHQYDWIRSGSVCVWVTADDGSPAALMWCHVGNHVDRYLGSWSRPSERVVYVNSVMTRADLRGQGFAKVILHTGMRELSQRGFEKIRTATAPDNGASVAFHERAGLSRVGTLVGVRAGPFHLEHVSRS